MIHFFRVLESGLRDERCCAAIYFTVLLCPRLDHGFRSRTSVKMIRCAKHTSVCCSVDSTNLWIWGFGRNVELVWT